MLGLDTPSLVPRDGYSTTEGVLVPRDGYSATEGVLVPRDGYSTTESGSLVE